MKRYALIAALLAAAGCESRVIMETPLSVSVEHDMAFKAEAFRKAAAHCARYGKHAVHLSTTGGTWVVSSFRCEGFDDSAIIDEPVNRH